MPRRAHPLLQGGKKGHSKHQNYSQTHAEVLLWFIALPCMTGLSTIGLDTKPRKKEIEKQECNDENFRQQDLVWACFRVLYKLIISFLILIA